MPQALSSAQLLELWEAATGETSVGGAHSNLALLLAAHPENTSEELAALPLGECHQRLLRLRARLFGDRLECIAACPECGEELEMSLSVNELFAASEEGSPKAPGEAGIGPSEVALDLADSALRLRARPPALADLLGVANEDAANEDAANEDAEGRLLERCVLEARRHGATIPAAALEPEEVAELGRRLAEADPWLELWLDLECDSCGHRFRQPLDPGAYLATELEIAAAKLLAQIHRLAWSYGWSEREILALSPQRRRAYLEHLE